MPIKKDSISGKRCVTSIEENVSLSLFMHVLDIATSRSHSQLRNGNRSMFLVRFSFNNETFFYRISLYMFIKLHVRRYVAHVLKKRMNCAIFRSQIAWQSYTKWTTRWNEELGWTNWSLSWTNGEHRSPAVPPSPRTPSIYFGYTFTWRRGGASWRYARCSVVPSSPRCLT